MILFSNGFVSISNVNIGVFLGNYLAIWNSELTINFVSSQNNNTEYIFELFNMTVWLLTSFNENLDVKLINTQSIKSFIFMSVVSMQFDTHLLKKRSTFREL